MLIVQQPSAGIPLDFAVNSVMSTMLSVIGRLLCSSAITRNAELDRHLPNCLQMAATCCMEMGGAHVQPRPIKLMLDCGAICRRFADSCKAMASEMI